MPDIDLTVQRDLGKLEQEVKDIKVEVKEVKAGLREVLEFVHETKGGQKWIWISFTVFTSIASTITGVLTYLFNRG